MGYANAPVTSREYKLMLNTDRFDDERKSTKVFADIVEFLTSKIGGEVIKRQDDEKPETRQTRYLDTVRWAFRRRGFILRVREEEDDGDLEYKITLKYRSLDRYLAAVQNLTSHAEGKKTRKFEEDILPPFRSQFSHSMAIKTPTLPALKTMGDVIALFPGLRDFGLSNTMPLHIVNNFTAHEIVQNVCHIQFQDSMKIKAGLSFWYFDAKTTAWPLVTEFAFDYDVEDAIAAPQLEAYPTSVVEGARRLFHTLQKQSGWVNAAMTTKTAFVYEGF
jgi:hypothetical protein